MAREDTYEGWANRETWAVNLWLANDKPLYDDVRHLAQVARESTDGGPERDAVYDLEARIREYVEEFVLGDDPMGTLGGIRTDLLTGALGKVDYREIAEAWLED